MNSNSISLEALKALENLGTDSLALPEIQSDNCSAFISMELRAVLRENNLIHQKIHFHTLEKNGIMARANKTVGESLSDKVITDFGDAEREIAKVIHWYNFERKHSSLHYLNPRQFHRGDPNEMLKIREEKIGWARTLRKKRNMLEEGEVAGTVS